MKDKKIDILNLENEKTSSGKKLPLVFKIIAIILIITLLFIPVVFG